MNVLQTTGVTLEEVRIENITKAFFYAVARLTGDNGTHELDVKPSDAIGLAVLMGSPI